jgi:hypothetical protein
MNEAAALPSPRVLLSRRLKQYYGRLRRPPGSRPLPGSSPVIGQGRSSSSPQNHRAGEGLPSSRRHHANVPSPLRRGVHRGCASRLYTPSMAFAVTHSARLSLSRPKTVALTARQASLEATDRSLAPPKRAFDAGLRPDPFPDRAASLLPGLLAATRTGLTPAGDDELMLDHDLHIDLQRLGALWLTTQAIPRGSAAQVGNLSAPLLPLGNAAAMPRGVAPDDLEHSGRDRRRDCRSARPSDTRPGGVR